MGGQHYDLLTHDLPGDSRDKRTLAPHSRVGPYESDARTLCRQRLDQRASEVATAAGDDDGAFGKGFHGDPKFDLAVASDRGCSNLPR